MKKMTILFSVFLFCIGGIFGFSAHHFAYCETTEKKPFIDMPEEPVKNGDELFVIWANADTIYLGYIH